MLDKSGECRYNYYACLSRAGIAQLVEQLICNQQVGGSSPSTSSIEPLSGAGCAFRLQERFAPAAAHAHKQASNMGEFPSGQRGQTVNLLALPTVVRIHLPPPIPDVKTSGIFVISLVNSGIILVKCSEILSQISFDPNADPNGLVYAWTELGFSRHFMIICHDVLDSVSACTSRMKASIRLALSCFIPSVACA